VMPCELCRYIAIPGFFPPGGYGFSRGGIRTQSPLDSAREFDTSLPIVAVLLHKTQLNLVWTISKCRSKTVWSNR
jgi:predicted acylesterase/phospholipase RssA